MSFIKAVNIIKLKKRKIILSKNWYLILNKFLKNKIIVKNIIRIVIILIIILPAIKAKGINANNKLKKFVFVQRQWWATTDHGMSEFTMIFPHFNTVILMI